MPLASTAVGSWRVSITGWESGVCHVIRDAGSTSDSAPFGVFAFALSGGKGGFAFAMGSVLTTGTVRFLRPLSDGARDRVRSCHLPRRPSGASLQTPHPPSGHLLPKGEGKGGWQRPVSDSLGLLPSGPDPVGERHARRQPPGEGIAQHPRRHKCRNGPIAHYCLRSLGAIY